VNQKWESQENLKIQILIYHLYAVSGLFSYSPRTVNYIQYDRLSSFAVCVKVLSLSGPKVPVFETNTVLLKAVKGSGSL